MVKETELLNDELSKNFEKQIPFYGILHVVSKALTKINEGRIKIIEGCRELSELSDVFEKDDLSFLSLMGTKLSPEHAAEITNALQSRGLLYEGGESVPPPSYETTSAVVAPPSPTLEEYKPKRRGKPIYDLFRNATISAKWASLCKEFFAQNMNDEIDSSQSNRVLQRFAWFLSVWEERGLLVVQIFSPAVRFLQALDFRLSVGFQTCTNVLREIFARREDYQDAKSEVLAFCMAHA